MQKTSWRKIALRTAAGAALAIGLTAGTALAVCYGPTPPFDTNTCYQVAASINNAHSGQYAYCVTWPYNPRESQLMVCQ